MEPTTKICKDCKINKKLDKYSIDSKNKDNLKPRCNICEALRVKAYYKTKDGLISQIYCNQKKSSITRKHNPPLYTKQQLKEWVFSHPDFEKLFYKWKNSKNKHDAPSIDRLDDNKGYSFDNIRLTTWKENQRKAFSDRLNGINASEKICKKILQYTKDNKFVCGFVSQKEAERQTGIHQGNISACCRGVAKSAGGYLWFPATQVM